MNKFNLFILFSLLQILQKFYTTVMIKAPTDIMQNHEDKVIDTKIISKNHQHLSKNIPLNKLNIPIIPVKSQVILIFMTVLLTVFLVDNIINIIKFIILEQTPLKQNLSMDLNQIKNIFDESNQLDSIHLQRKDSDTLKSDLTQENKLYMIRYKCQRHLDNKIKNKINLVYGIMMIIFIMIILLPLYTQYTFIQGLINFHLITFVSLLIINISFFSYIGIKFAMNSSKIQTVCNLLDNYSTLTIIIKSIGNIIYILIIWYEMKNLWHTNKKLSMSNKLYKLFIDNNFNIFKYLLIYSMGLFLIDRYIP